MSTTIWCLFICQPEIVVAIDVFLLLTAKSSILNIRIKMKDKRQKH